MDEDEGVEFLVRVVSVVGLWVRFGAFKRVCQVFSGVLRD